MALKTTNGTYISPTTILNHELDHAVGNSQNPKKHSERTRTFDKKYDTKEEQRVITGSEQETAKALGEIKKTEKTREDHSGSFVPVIGPLFSQPVFIKPIYFKPVIR